MLMFIRSRPGKGDANRAYAESDSPGAERGSKSDAYNCFVIIITQKGPV